MGKKSKNDRKRYYSFKFTSSLLHTHLFRHLGGFPVFRFFFKTSRNFHTLSDKLKCHFGISVGFKLLSFNDRPRISFVSLSLQFIVWHHFLSPKFLAVSINFSSKIYFPEMQTVFENFLSLNKDRFIIICTTFYFLISFFVIFLLRVYLGFTLIVQESFPEKYIYKM